MKTLDLGSLRPKWRGRFSPYETYKANDIVRFDGGVYRCTNASVEFLPTNPLYFEPLAFGTNILQSKGQILTHDGQVQIPLTAGNNGEYLKMVEGMPTWAKQEGRSGASCVALVKGSQKNSVKTSCFLMDDNTIRTCGEGTSYANGDGTGNHIYLPQTVGTDPDNPPTTPFVAIYANHYAFFALTKDGGVYAWGHNDYGQLGLGNTLDTPIATLIRFFKENNIKIREVICPHECHLHDTQTYFLTTDGELYACGYNGKGQLGNGTITNSNIPVRCGFLTGIQKVEVSCSNITSVFALDSNDEVWAWGCNTQGQLGFGDVTQRNSPVKVAGISNIKDIIAVGGQNGAGTGNYNHAMILTHDGKVYTSGSNFAGQLGHGDMVQKSAFMPVITDKKAVQIIFGGGAYGHLGIIDEAGDLWVCGNNTHGELGLNDTTPRTLLNRIEAPFQGNIVKVEFFGSHDQSFTVVLDNNGVLWGAGYNVYGQIARGSGFVAINSGFVPLASPLLTTGIKFVDFATCGISSEMSLFALTEDGRVFSCGYNGYGALGTQPANLHKGGILQTVLF